MAEFPEVRWLLDSEPRAVQLEALRRSFYGYALYDQRPDPSGVATGRAAGGVPAGAAPILAGLGPVPAGGQPVGGAGVPRWLPRGPGPAWGWGHFLEMRLGKTPTVLNEFMLYRLQGLRKMVVISPNSYKYDWAMEVGKFGIDIPAIVYETSAAEQIEKYIKDAGDEYILILNYEALQYEKTQILLEKVLDKNTFLVADESIKIKNHTSITTRVALELSKMAGPTRIMTGLPMTQGPQDLYSQFRFIRMLNGKNYFAFRNRYCKMGGFKAKKVVGVKEENQPELNRMLGENTLVAKRLHWGNPHIPEYNTVNLELSPIQLKHYREMDQDFITTLESGFEVTVDQVISKLLKLQQISSGFLYLPDKTSVKLMPLTETPKMKKLLEMMNDEITSKVVVAYHYGFSGDALLEVLKPWNPAVIRSKQWMQKAGKDVVSEKKRFNNDPDCRVMVLQITAGKYGHDLSGREGDRTELMVFYENNYSLDDRVQVEMRPTALDQDWSNLYLDFASSKVERDVLKAVVKKEDLVTAIFGSYGRDRHSKERD